MRARLDPCVSNRNNRFNSFLNLSTARRHIAKSASAARVPKSADPKVGTPEITT